jgi:transposase
VVDIEELPDDTKKLKAILVEQRQAYVELQEKFETLRRLYFGQSSEKLTEEDRRQMRLFNEAEELAEGSTEAATEEPASLTVGEHRRKKPGRKAISKDLPREEVIHDLDSEQKRCECCGEDRPLLDEESSEEIEIIPASVKVLRHIRKVYGPCRCKGFESSEQLPILRAAMPPRMIPGSIAAAGALAYVVTSKFVDALPLYRQEKIFSRFGVEISRSTLANWVIAVAARCGPLIDLMWQLIGKAVFQQMDETTTQVLHEPGRPPTAKSYIWVNLGHVEVEGQEELKSIILYHYHPSRAAAVVTSTLAGYEGYLQTDGYEAYEAGLRAEEGIIHLGCLAHVRRKFFEAAKLTKKPGSAQQALAFIAKVYRIETECREQLSGGKVSREQFVERRDEQARPILEQFMKWLDERSEQVPPTSKLGEAIGYARRQMPKIMRYLDAWFLTPDNNAVERAIRPFVIGRSNWLFSETPRGAHASAAIYSLVETAKANGLEPYHYSRYLFTHLPTVNSEEDLAKLLPMNLRPTDLLDF